MFKVEYWDGNGGRRDVETAPDRDAAERLKKELNEDGYDAEITEV